MRNSGKSIVPLPKIIKIHYDINIDSLTLEALKYFHINRENKGLFSI